MSDNHNVTVVSLISFAVGLLVGAIVTLFLAPMSGRELRTQIHDHAQADWQRATDQLNQTRADMSRQLESLRQQMDVYDQRIRGQLNQLQAKLNNQTPTDSAEAAASIDMNVEQGA